MLLTRKDLILCCHECGSGDVHFCGISIRPYCGECRYWAPVNNGTEHDTVSIWNSKVERMWGKDMSEKPQYNNLPNTTTKLTKELYKALVVELVAQCS